MTTACQGDDISLLATAPNVGFEMEIEDEGPEVVEVDFESTTHRSRFKAECVDGQINEEIREEPED